MLIDLLSAIDESVEPISLDIGSDELSMMRAYVDEANYQGIYDLTLSLAEKNIYDVRMLSYAIYSETIEDKLATLENLYQTLNILLDSAWHAVGPEGKRDKYAKTSLPWIFKQILIDLQTLEIEAGPLWQSWITTYTPENVYSFISASEVTRSALSTVLAEEAGTVLEKITELNNWFKDFIKLLPVPVQAEESVSLDTSTPSSEENTASSGSENRGIGTTGSVHLDLLIQKMEVFERVVEKGDILKAAVVVMDINQALESFDPKLYFPDIFSRYYFLMVQNISTITEVMDLQDSPQWMALNQLYQVDKKGFIDVDL